MATKFLEPGGDATGNVATTGTIAAPGLWGTTSGSPVVATDFVNGSHVNSIKYIVNSTCDAFTPAGTVSDAGARISVYMYFNALPSATSTLISIRNSGSSNLVTLRMTSGGTLQLWNAISAQIGSNGSTLSTGVWYRLSISYTIASTSVNEFRVFLNGVSDISVTNATISTIITSIVSFGNNSGNLTLDMRSSDHYVDDSSALTDPGNIWVTAKRPNANGTTNGFTTQIGSGGSGYGTGHSPQVNERALSKTNGWSMVGAGSAVTEEYSVEAANVGDINISTATIVDWLSWVVADAVVGENASIIAGGTSSSYVTPASPNTRLVTLIKGSTTYPAGGTDVGIISDTTLTTLSLYECGVIVAYIPAVVAATAINNSNLLSLGVG